MFYRKNIIGCCLLGTKALRFRGQGKRWNLWCYTRNPSHRFQGLLPQESQYFGQAYRVSQITENYDRSVLRRDHYSCGTESRPREIDISTSFCRLSSFAWNGYCGTEEYSRRRTSSRHFGFLANCDFHWDVVISQWNCHVGSGKRIGLNWLN